MAGGGDVTPGRAFLVGEKHPEILIPQEAGRIVPQVAVGDGDFNQVINIATPDSESFRKSSSQVASEMHMALAGARRNGQA